ncbi:MAG: hypothetical protein WD601_08755, partial [Pseudohongiellaceae bacterium]
ARAQIAWQLGKRYEQDEALDWGVAVVAEARADTDTGSAAHALKPETGDYKEAGSTLQASRKRKKKSAKS